MSVKMRKRKPLRTSLKKKKLLKLIRQARLQKMAQKNDQADACEKQLLESNNTSEQDTTDKKEETTNRQGRDVNTTMDKFRKRLIHTVAQYAQGNKPLEELWPNMQALTFDCKQLWKRMRALTIKKISRLLPADDRTDRITEVARMTYADWLMFDLVLVHEDIDLITPETKNESNSSEVPKVLKELFVVVQRFGLEDTPNAYDPGSWAAAAMFYNHNGQRNVSPMLLQKRWYQLKKATRASFVNFWQMYKGRKDMIEKTRDVQPDVLQQAIAKRYNKIVIQDFPSWKQLVEKNEIVMPDAFTRKIKTLPEPCELDNPDLILLEPDIETIDLDEDSYSDDNDAQNPESIEETEEMTDQPNDLNEDSSSAPIDTLDVSLVRTEEDLGIKCEPIEVDNLEFEEEEHINPLSDIVEQERLIEEEERGDKIDDQDEDDRLSYTENTDYQNNFDREYGVSDVAQHDRSRDNDIGFGTQYNAKPNDSFALEIIDDECVSEPVIQIDDINRNLAGVGEAVESGISEVKIINVQSVNEDIIHENSLRNVETSNKAVEDVTGSIVDESSKLLVHDTYPSIQTADLEFVDDGIELIEDDDAVENIEANTTVESYFEDTSKKEEHNNVTEIITEEDSVQEGKFDLKLIMIPVVYTTKLDHMTVLKNVPCRDSIEVSNIMNDIILESMPISAKSMNVRNEIADLDDNEKEDSFHSDNERDTDDLIKLASVDNEKHEEPIQRIKLSSSLFRKPRVREYSPIQLCKNPDFNTKLKHLSVGFCTIARNRQFLKLCKPATIDLHKSFEDVLDNGSLYIEKTDLVETNKTQDIQLNPIIPTAMPMQSLVDKENVDMIDLSKYSSSTNLRETFEEAYNNVPKTIDSCNIIETNKLNNHVLATETSFSQTRRDADIHPNALSEVSRAITCGYNNFNLGNDESIDLENESGNTNCENIGSMNKISKYKKWRKFEHLTKQLKNVNSKIKWKPKDDTSNLIPKQRKLPARVAVPWLIAIKPQQYEDFNLTVDSLNNMLQALGDTNIVCVKGKYIEKKTRNKNEASRKENVEDPEKIKKRQLAKLEKYRRKRTYCCWHSEFYFKKVNTNHRPRKVSRHKCLDVCICCCKHLKENKELTTSDEKEKDESVTMVNPETQDLNRQEAESAVQNLQEIVMTIPEVSTNTTNPDQKAQQSAVQNLQEIVMTISKVSADRTDPDQKEQQSAVQNLHELVMNIPEVSTNRKNPYKKSQQSAVHNLRESVMTISNVSSNRTDRKQKARRSAKSVATIPKDTNRTIPDSNAQDCIVLSDEENDVTPIRPKFRVISKPFVSKSSQFESDKKIIDGNSVIPENITTKTLSESNNIELTEADHGSSSTASSQFMVLSKDSNIVSHLTPLSNKKFSLSVNYDGKTMQVELSPQGKNAISEHKNNTIISASRSNMRVENIVTQTNGLSVNQFGLPNGVYLVLGSDNQIIPYTEYGCKFSDNELESIQNIVSFVQNQFDQQTNIVSDKPESCDSTLTESNVITDVENINCTHLSDIETVQCVDSSENKIKNKTVTLKTMNHYQPQIQYLTNEPIDVDEDEVLHCVKSVENNVQNISGIKTSTISESQTHDLSGQSINLNDEVIHVVASSENIDQNASHNIERTVNNKSQVNNSNRQSFENKNIIDDEKLMNKNLEVPYNDVITENIANFEYVMENNESVISGVQDLNVSGVQDLNVSDEKTNILNNSPTNQSFVQSEKTPTKNKDQEEKMITNYKTSKGLKLKKFAALSESFTGSCNNISAEKTSILSDLMQMSGIFSDDSLTSPEKPTHRQTSTIKMNHSENNTLSNPAFEEGISTEECVGSKRINMNTQTIPIRIMTPEEFNSCDTQRQNAKIVYIKKVIVNDGHSSVQKHQTQVIDLDSGEEEILPTVSQPLMENQQTKYVLSSNEALNSVERDIIKTMLEKKGPSILRHPQKINVKVNNTFENNVVLIQRGMYENKKNRGNHRNDAQVEVTIDLIDSDAPMEEEYLVDSFDSDSLEPVQLQAGIVSTSKSTVSHEKKNKTETNDHSTSSRKSRTRKRKKKTSKNHDKEEEDDTDSDSCPLLTLKTKKVDLIKNLKSKLTTGRSALVTKKGEEKIEESRSEIDTDSSDDEPLAKKVLRRIDDATKTDTDGNISDLTNDRETPLNTEIDKESIPMSERNYINISSTNQESDPKPDNPQFILPECIYYEEMENEDDLITS